MEFRFQERLAATSVSEPAEERLTSRTQLAAEIVSIFEGVRDRSLRHLVSIGLPVHQGKKWRRRLFWPVSPFGASSNARISMRGCSAWLTIWL
jgi:hypothetical protein